MMLIALENVTKLFAEQVIFLGVNVRVEEGDRIGLVGGNGAGKTTLLDTLWGTFPPDEGERSINSGITMGMLRQNSGVDSSNTVYEEMREVFRPLLDAQARMQEISQQLEQLDAAQETEFAELSEEYNQKQSFFESNEGYRMDAKIRTVLAGMRFSHREQDSCDVLSGGEKTRLAMAKLLLLAPDLLMLDEPTNHLDFEALRWLEEYLQSYRGALVVVSHDRYFLDRVCNKIWAMTNMKVVSYAGNYTKYLFTREMAYKRELKEYQMQSLHISKLSDYIARNKVRASSAAMAKSREKVLEKQKESAKEPPRPLYPIRLQFRFENASAEKVLHIEEVSMYVGEDSNRRLLFSQISLDIQRGERVALVGANGIGKTCFLQGILGRMHLASGRVQWGINAKISYYEQDDACLNHLKPALHEVWDRFPSTYERDVRRVLAGVGLHTDSMEKRVGDLSGGERARLKLANMIYQEGNILVLDEPTNHFDIQAKDAIQKALLNYEGTVLFVTHDRYLLSKVATRVVELRADALLDYPGGYEQYLAMQVIPPEPEQPPEIAPPSAGEKTETTYHRSKKQRALDVARKTRLAEVENEISVTELEIAAAQVQLEDPVVSRDYQVTQQVLNQLNLLRIQLNEQVEEWAELYELCGLGDEPPVPMKNKTPEEQAAERVPEAYRVFQEEDRGRVLSLPDKQ